MANKMVIVDMDGVLADFDTAFDSYIRKYIPELGEQIKTAYDFRDRYDYNPMKLLRLFEKFARDGKFLELKPYPDIHKANEFNATIITSRPRVAMSDTMVWLKANKIKFKKIIMVRNKNKYIEDAVAIFEDKTKNIMPFAKAGIKCFIYDHPYNQDAQHDNITRFNGWSSLDTVALRKEFNGKN